MTGAAEYAPLNNHERIRRELWVQVFTEAMKARRLTPPATIADRALDQFDQRFQHPGAR